MDLVIMFSCFILCVSKNVFYMKLIVKINIFVMCVKIKIFVMCDMVWLVIFDVSYLIFLI